MIAKAIKTVAIALVLTIGLSLVGHVIAGSGPKYLVSNIPDSMRKNVNAVIREDIQEFRIYTKNKAVLKGIRAVTILNPGGNDYARLILGYDKQRKIVQFDGAAFDQNGKEIKKLKNSEIYDQSAFDGFSLYSDNRLKAADLSQGFYPYTVEFEYEVVFENLFQIPGFELLPDETTSSLHSKFSLHYPPALQPRYKEHNIAVRPVTTAVQNEEVVTWEFFNTQPIKTEPFTKGFGSHVPAILVAPNVFDFDGYDGTMTTWDEFGSWIALLAKGREILPEETKAKIRDLTKNAQTTEEKVRIIYSYLQNKTRYVSIQLGIGGFQPFEAKVVDQTGYGDCKALSNYTVALLQAADIKANYVLIEAGNDYTFDPDFVSSQFNHAIVAVPNGRDTIWLECTSQTNPFGYMGKFTGDRKALLITDNGAKVVNTLSYPTEVNVQSRKSTVKLASSGDATAHVLTSYAGLQYENQGLHFLLSNQYDEQRKWILNNTEIPSFNLTKFKISAINEKIPSAFVESELELKRYATISGKRLMFLPNLMNRMDFVPPNNDQRKTDIFRKTGFVDIDTIHYELPENIYPEFLPEPVKITSQFGEYEVTVKHDETGLTYVRKLKMNKGEFPATAYKEFVEFYKGIKKADNMKLVFLNKT